MTDSLTPHSVAGYPLHYNLETASAKRPAVHPKKYLMLIVCDLRSVLLPPIAAFDTCAGDVPLPVGLHIKVAGTKRA